MSPSEVEACLAGPHQAVLSVGRDKRGPVAVPMSYVFEDGRFWMITSPDSLHGSLMRRIGRATITVHHEDCAPRLVRQWYVIAEGGIEFRDDDPAPLLRRLMAKDRGEEWAEDWTARALPHATSVAVLTPRTMSGYRFEERLD